jgi:hypothetical protein
MEYLLTKEQMLHVFVGLVGSYMLISMVEWYFHAKQMHKCGVFNRFSPSYYNHNIRHHPAYHKDFTSPNPVEDKHIGIGISYWYTTVFVAIPLLVIGYWLPIECGILYIVLMVHHYMWNKVHNEMHIPTNAWFSKTRLYKVWLRHHELHHDFPNHNFGALFLGADIIMRTKVNDTYRTSKNRRTMRVSVRQNARSSRSKSSRST